MYSHCVPLHIAYIVHSFVEYETKEDLMKAVEELNDREFKGNGIKVHCIADVSYPISTKTPVTLTVR